MAALPYMQFYVSDYLGGTGHLTTEEHGAYLLLIFNYWQRGKPLPSDPERLANLARLSNERWTVVERTLAEFFNVTATEWRHTRIDDDLAAVIGTQDQRINAGKASALARKQAKAQQAFNGRSTVAEQAFNDTDTDTHIEKKDQKKGAALSLPPWLQESVWADWHAFRNTRKGWTPKARALSLSTLAKLREQGHDPKAIVEQSIERGWTGLFPIRSESHAGRNKGGAISAAERVAAVNAEAERRQYAEVIPGEFRNVG